MNYEAQVKKVAKTLVKEFKANKEASSIPLQSSFDWIGTNTKSGYWFRHDDSKLNLFFGELDEEGLARLTRDVANVIDGLLKLPKKMLVFKDVKEHSKWMGWSSYKYTLVKKYVIITPCKQFLSINKKLIKLGLKPIPFEEWYWGDVSGKRDHIFSVEKNYYCTNEMKCNEVLNILKGKKKLSYEIVRVEDFEDREYGIRHETEWYGHLYYRLKFTDAKGKTALI